MKKIIIERLKNKYKVLIPSSGEKSKKVVIVTAFSFLGNRLDLWGNGKIEIAINQRKDEVYFENRKLKIMEEFKKHKWSLKFKNCQICGKTESKHIGNGLCSKCYDKKRYISLSDEKYFRRQTFPSIRVNFCKRIKTILNPKKIGRPKILSKEEEIKRKLESNKKWRNKNKRLSNLLTRISRMKKSGKKLLKIIVREKEYFFPFEGIPDKPKTTSKEYMNWKQITSDFEFLRKYYFNKK